MARSRRVRSTRGNGSAAGNRATVVWLSLAGAMTAVGGLLMALDGRSAPRVGGLAMPALAAVGTVGELEQIFTSVPKLDRNRWQAIVIHHSSGDFGSPETIAAQHVRAGLRNLGHQFLIGNGRGMGDGEVHVGERWIRQQSGAHAMGQTRMWLNEHAISICLVGNGDQQGFTKLQMAKLMELVQTLRAELKIPANRVYLHSDVAPTTDPGQLFPASEFRARLGSN